MEDEDLMEMPTPCPTCTKVVELNDMNTCEKCRQCFCNKCLRDSWALCPVCREEVEEEQER